jgi:cytoskeletal protein CcmA (bactofilin family)
MFVTKDVSMNGNVVIHGDLSSNYVHASIPNSALEEPFYHVEYTPIGGIIIWNNATTMPPGYTVCDGRTVNDIKTPDLRGKFVIGYDASNSHLNSIDNSGGSFIIENDDLPAYQYQFEESDISEYILGGTPVVDASYSMPYYVMIYIMRTSNVITDVAALQRNSDISLNFHLAVARTTTLRSTLDVSGATTFYSTLDVSGSTTFNSHVAFGGDVSMNSRLDVSDNAIFNSHVAFNNDASMNSRLDVSGNATFSSDMVVHGDVSLNSNLLVAGDLSLNGDLSIQGNLSVFQTTDTVTINTTVNNYEVIVTNDMSLNGNIVVSGASSLRSSLDVSGATILDSTLNVTKAAALASTLDVSGATILDSTLNVTKAAALASTLDVSGATILGSTLVVNGDISFNSTRVDICGNFYAVYPDNSIPASAIVGDVGGGMSSSSILQQF